MERTSINHDILDWHRQRNITSQKPRRQSRERDERKIQQWLNERWPELKKVAAGAHLPLIDESVLMLAPLVRRTLARRGQTPVLKQQASHGDRVSVVAGLSLSARRLRRGLFFQTHLKRSINNGKAAGFLRTALRQLRGPVVVLWGQRADASREADPRAVGAVPAAVDRMSAALRPTGSPAPSRFDALPQRHRISLPLSTPGTT